MSDDTVLPYEALRQGLIWGRWKSGERLAPQRLKEEFNCSSSVLREAMLRLASEGLMVSEKNLGFSAVTHSKDTFREAAHLRLILEREAAELSLKQGDFDWELALTAAYQKLAYIEQQMTEKGDISGLVRHWSIHDWEFHHTLMSACGSSLLLRAYKSAFDVFRMYAVAEIAEFGFGREVTMREHKSIYDAAISRDIPGCLSAIEAHVIIYQDKNRSNKPLPPKGQTAMKLQGVKGTLKS
ncbi:MAG: GntR family transcriptional regulator [Granulosicoccus sp.]